MAPANTPDTFQVYDYKKSLRMPARLITVSKPSQFHRLSTSLPDLDPGSPSLSMDSSDICLAKKPTDTDLESNSSKVDDEEATSSTVLSLPSKTTTPKKSSIVDVLAQKVGTKEAKKKQSPKSPKVLPKKSNNKPELLPTPSLEKTQEEAKHKSPSKNKSKAKACESMLLGYFRKETVNNFRNAFRNNHALPDEFSALVLKSRTRTETRVMKQQATIKQVFGEDRPASAPPMQNHSGDTSQEDESSQRRTLKEKVVSRLRSAGILQGGRKGRHLRQRRKSLIESMAERKRTKKAQEDKGVVKEERVEEGEGEDNNNEQGESNESRKKRFRSGRKKFRSGFDYIRKKKKAAVAAKKEESAPREKKRVGCGVFVYLFFFTVLGV